MALGGRAASCGWADSQPWPSFQLTGTSYGRIMVVELAAVVLLLSVANLSRQ
ncbi:MULTISPECIES: hypothetical protein [unclassified Streptomyces]|uniref:hypothetical protein n=1 Tax=unclassified Streptomyces TaxID=2593676 RepID=UPI0040432064